MEGWLWGKRPLPLIILHRKGVSGVCLAVPMLVEEITWPQAAVSSGGLRQLVNIELVPEVQTGEYVLVHAGFALQTVQIQGLQEDCLRWLELVNE